MVQQAGDITRRVCLVMLATAWSTTLAQAAQIGSETGATRRLADGEEYSLPASELIGIGAQLFSASWTREEGAGRPLSKGTGEPLSDQSRSLGGGNQVNVIEADACLTQRLINHRPDHFEAPKIFHR